MAASTVRHTQTELGHFFDNARVLFLNGQACFRIARALSEHTDNLLFADPYLDFGVPRLLTSLSQLEAYTRLTAPVMFSPNAVKVIERLHRTPLYRMGQKLISGSLHESVRDCHVIVGAMGDLETFTEKELDGKTVITSRVTESALDWFRSRKVAMVVDYSPSGALGAAHDAAKRIGRVSIGKSGKMVGKAMVVGATGAIGSVCARLLAKAVDEIYMVAPEAAKLLALKESIELETPGAIVHVAATTDRDLADMDMVVTATSGAGKRILDIMQVKPGCVITDVARPLAAEATEPT
jgi:hypothetical protein